MKSYASVGGAPRGSRPLNHCERQSWYLSVDEERRCELTGSWMRSERGEKVKRTGRDGLAAGIQVAAQRSANLSLLAVEAVERQGRLASVCASFGRRTRHSRLIDPKTSITLVS